MSFSFEWRLYIDRIGRLQLLEPARERIEELLLHGGAMQGIKARTRHEFAADHPHPGIDEIEPADVARDLGTLAPHALAHCDRGDHRVVQMDVDAQQPAAVRPGTGKGHAGIHESCDRHARFARDAEQKSKLLRTQRRGHHEAHRSRRTRDIAPQMSEMQVRKVSVRASGRGSHQQRALIELVPEAVVHIERLDARGTQCFVADDDGLAVHQCIAGTRVPDLAVDRQQQAGVIDLDGPSAHARYFSGAPHVLEQVLIEVVLGVEHHALLGQLQLVQEEHDDDARGQRCEGCVERDAERFGHAVDVS